MSAHITLLQPACAGTMSLEEAIRARRTARMFSGAQLTQAELAQLLWAAGGTTSAQGHTTTPSAGAQYPLHIHVFAAAVEDVPVGLYAYGGEQHALTRLTADDLRPALGRAAIGEQPWIDKASALIIVLADMAGMSAHFQDQPPHGERGRRYAWIESGALAENLYLQATSLGLGSVLVGGFVDAQVQAALPIHTLQPTLLMCIGKKCNKS